eukprot:3846105-Pleurochrysis_carterae.AAC.1
MATPLHEGAHSDAYALALLRTRVRAAVVAMLRVDREWVHRVERDRREELAGEARVLADDAHLA